MRPGEQETIELVNAVVDGVATAEEQAELQRLVATSAEVRDMLEATREIARRLEAMNVDPPKELREAWLAALPARDSRLEIRDSTRPPSESRISNLESRVPTGRRRLFAVAWAAAAALVLVFLIIGRQQMTDTGATMAPAWPVVERIASTHGTLLVRRQGELYCLEAVVTRPGAVEIAWDPSKLSFIGVLDEKSASLRKASVEFTLRDPSQRAGVIVRPRRGASAAEIVVSVGSTEVFRRVVALK